MITYRNQLKNKIDSLQKLINEINESGLEGINIREGVIVDMTCNIIITSSLITDELTSTKINTNELTTNELTTTKINTNELTTNELTTTKINTNELTTNELTSNNLMITSSNNNLSLNATEINGSSTKANLDQIVANSITSTTTLINNSIRICDMNQNMTLYHVKIQIRDSGNNYQLGTEAEGYAFVYYYTIRFFMCTCTVKSHMTGWYIPMVRAANSDNLTIYIKNYNSSSYRVQRLNYIVGQYYSTLNVGTIFQYSNVSRYENRVYRDSSGAIFPYEGCLIEWTYGQLTP